MDEAICAGDISAPAAVVPWALSPRAEEDVVVVVDAAEAAPNGLGPDAIVARSLR